MRENTCWELTTFADYHYVTRRCFNLENTPDILIEHFIDGVLSAPGGSHVGPMNFAICVGIIRGKGNQHFECLVTCIRECYCLGRYRCCLDTPNSKQEVSAPISCWVTFDPAESPILPGQNMCTYANEYNPWVSNEKSQVSLKSAIEIKQIICVYMYGYKKIQGFLWKFCWLKNWRMWGFTPKIY